ncbi:hypothetical protein H1P_1410004 [Hyella patelloides LEGE 07179]|uniref:Uncharacterized protein n=1 Tax=Hyella patelloides LEGE 07179 TaxID=945734 RepID=A0A563VLH2_9CYAN|nr:hypothetical protein H1P_1410004 [Hyella patelloides LEGE 07179]
MNNMQVYIDRLDDKSSETKDRAIATV